MRATAPLETAAARPRWHTVREGDDLYGDIVDNAIEVTGARFVNLSWYDPADGHITGAAWSIRPRSFMDEAIRAAQAVIPGFNPLQVRFSGDVNPAVHRVLVEGHAVLAPFTELAAGTVPEPMIRIASTVVGLHWTHSVPLHVEGAVAGGLAFHFTQRPPPDRLTAAEAFAKVAALTLENARLSDALRTRAEEIERSHERIAATEERTRREIAHLLHGRVETRLLVATQRLLECRDLVRRDPARAGRVLAEVAEEFDRIRDDDVRRASHRLHPSVIAIGLVPALEMLSEEIEGLDVSVTASRAVMVLDDIARNALPEPVRLSGYRFVEEALAYLARSEAAAARVEVGLEVRAEGAALRLTVAEQPDRADTAVPIGGAGVRAIRDRVERASGTLVARNAPLALTAWLPLSATAARAPAARADRADLYQDIVESAVVVTAARMVSLSWYDPRDHMHQLGAVAPLPVLGRMLTAARAIVPGFDPSQLRFRADVNPLTEAVLVEGRPMLAPIAEHAAGTIHPAVLAAASSLLGLRWTHSVPLHVDGAVAGALAFHFTDRPTDRTLRASEAFAKQVALTLANTRLSAALRDYAEELTAARERTAALEERTRRGIAELLHGPVQARLLVTTHKLIETGPLIASDPGRASAILGELAADFDRIREEDLQRAIAQLHPSTIDVGLLPALRELSESLGPKIEVAVTATEAAAALDHPLSDRLPERIRLGLYRTVEEALANVARHARTDAASVHLDLDGDGRIRVTITDRGVGHDPESARTGVGMRSMRERVEGLGGHLHVESAPGSGTTVVAALPLGRGR